MQEATEHYWCGCVRRLRVKRCDQHADLEVDDNVPSQQSRPERKARAAEVARSDVFEELADRWEAEARGECRGESRRMLLACAVELRAITRGKK